jgi:hypothetical protein
MRFFCPTCGLGWLDPKLKRSLVLNIYCLDIFLEKTKENEP